MSKTVMNELIRELSAAHWACGAAKKSKQPFCIGCYAALSPAQRKALSRRVGQGYEEANASATHSLRRNREIGWLSGTAGWPSEDAAKHH
jgi:hypothetical protein